MEEIIIAVMSGPQDGAVLPFETRAEPDDPTEITIGRREGCDICLSYDSQVSREHAILTYDGERFWLEDTRSTNGTYVRGDKITGRVEIAPGELFRIGRIWLRVEPVAHFNSPLPGDDDDLPF